MRTSLHNARGASLVEYSLLLFVMIGGAAAAIKQTGFEVRDAFEATSVIMDGAGAGGGGGSGGGGGPGGSATGNGGGNSGENTGIRYPGGRDGARR